MNVVARNGVVVTTRRCIGVLHRQTGYIIACMERITGYKRPSSSICPQVSGQVRAMSGGTVDDKDTVLSLRGARLDPRLLASVC